jgi:hypothetical protein
MPAPDLPDRDPISGPMSEEPMNTPEHDPMNPADDMPVNTEQPTPVTGNVVPFTLRPDSASTG